MFESATTLSAAVLRGERRPTDLVEEALSAAEARAHLGALISLVPDAREQAARVEARLAAGETPLLAGVPVVVKDNLNLRGSRTTCGSRILSSYVSPYTATVVRRLQDAGAVIVAKGNMDEFAMGSSNETSAFGPARNPWDVSRVPGGSSGGSAVAVAAGVVPLSLGSDTGGSIRQPAAMTGVYGFKPTYGRVSRYGLVAYASSLDQVGPFARTASDLALSLDAIVGPDDLDATSLDTAPRFREALARDVRGLRFAFVREALAGNTSGVDAAMARTREVLEGLGATVTEVSLPTLEYGVAAYYLVATPEASSNLARYDGMVYGSRAAGVREVNASMSATRGEGFGTEVKRRVLMGTYALSSGYYDAYYSKAMKVRRLVADDLARAFADADVLVTPTSPFPAFRIGERMDDPVAMYAADVDTVIANLAGIPAVSVPAGFETLDGRELPVGVQFLAPALADELLVSVAAAFEAATSGAFLREPPL
ncbi:Asp-tRNA(Asn)/Glu-tRNA(Gln) amidotransferase subunit GatA [Deinococcus pimensis]|uniref:Asp-tRNA(Asn)/Glu-tRNA(Gln) amidotransferase subunit GatA n=1 Tax=Deinococcus pimensis TaxID=309888 RepID=UPI0004822C7E|nr:Asp-tRNA(Asn)/Glu-tRNA(Gln) amidotransferase subunit GatA [Deinococcus pimensis]